MKRIEFFLKSKLNNKDVIRYEQDYDHLFYYGKFTMLKCPMDDLWFLFYYKPGSLGTEKTIDRICKSDRLDIGVCVKAKPPKKKKKEIIPIPHTEVFGICREILISINPCYFMGKKLIKKTKIVNKENREEVEWKRPKKKIKQENQHDFFRNVAHNLRKRVLNRKYDYYKKVGDEKSLRVIFYIGTCGQKGIFKLNEQFQVGLLWNRYTNLLNFRYVKSVSFHLCTISKSDNFIIFPYKEKPEGVNWGLFALPHVQGKHIHYTNPKKRLFNGIRLRKGFSQDYADFKDVYVGDKSNKIIFNPGFIFINTISGDKTKWNKIKKNLIEICDCIDGNDNKFNIELLKGTKTNNFGKRKEKGFLLKCRDNNVRFSECSEKGLHPQFLQNSVSAIAKKEMLNAKKREELLVPKLEFMGYFSDFIRNCIKMIDSCFEKEFWFAAYCCLFALFLFLSGDVTKFKNVYWFSTYSQWFAIVFSNGFILPKFIKDCLKNTKLINSYLEFGFNFLSFSYCDRLFSKEMRKKINEIKTEEENRWVKVSYWYSMKPFSDEVLNSYFSIYLKDVLKEFKKQQFNKHIRNFNIEKVEVDIVFCFLVVQLFEVLGKNSPNPASKPDLLYCIAFFLYTYHLLLENDLFSGISVDEKECFKLNKVRFRNSMSKYGITMGIFREKLKIFKEPGRVWGVVSKPELICEKILRKIINPLAKLNKNKLIEDYLETALLPINRPVFEGVNESQRIGNDDEELDDYDDDELDDVNEFDPDEEYGDEEYGVSNRNFVPPGQYNDLNSLGGFNLVGENDIEDGGGEMMEIDSIENGNENEIDEIVDEDIEMGEECIPKDDEEITELKTDEEDMDITSEKVFFENDNW